jgi:hypothetical protein
MNRFSVKSSVKVPAALIAVAAGLAVTFAATGQTGPPSEKPAVPVPAAAQATAAPATAAVREIELPADTGTYRQAPGSELAQAFCLNCHSVEYCETQPPSGEKYWGATVKKMKEKFGAPLPDEAIAPLTKYLTETYGKAAP